MEKGKKKGVNFGEKEKKVDNFGEMEIKTENFEEEVSLDIK